MVYTKQPDGFGWNDYLDNPNDPYYIRQEMRPGDNVDISTYLAELALNSTSMFMNSPIGNAVLDALLMTDGEDVFKMDVYNMPVIQLVVR